MRDTGRRPQHLALQPRPEALVGSGRARVIGHVGGIRRVLVQQRDGVRAELIDPASGVAAPFAACLDAVLALVAEDADALGCADEAAAARAIVEDGASADRQQTVFDAARGQGLGEREALGAVVDWLAAATAGERP